MADKQTPGDTNSEFPPPGTPPIHVNLSPSHKYTIHFHDISMQIPSPRAYKCVTFVTDGMRQVGQQECMLTCIWSPGITLEGLKGQVFQLLKVIYEYAAKGVIATHGSQSNFGGGFITSNVRGVLYAEVDRALVSSLIPDGILDPKVSYLSVITLSSLEFDMYSIAGETRVLALLGNYYRTYPYPFWSDPGRQCVIGNYDLNNEILGSISKIRLKDCTTKLQKLDDTVILRILDKDCAKLTESFDKLAASQAIAIITGIGHREDCHLVWYPDANQGGLRVIGAPNSKGQHIGGSYLIIAPGDFKENKIVIMVDGFSLFINQETFSEIRARIKEKDTEYFVQTQKDSPSFKLLIASSTFINPIDGQKLVASSGWVTYGKDNKDNNDEVSVEIVLLTSDSELKKNVSVESLVSFIKPILSRVESYAKDKGPRIVPSAALQFEVDKESLKVTVSGSEEGDILSDETKNDLKDIGLQSGSSSLQVNGSIKFLVTLKHNGSISDNNNS